MHKSALSLVAMMAACGPAATGGKAPSPPRVTPVRVTAIEGLYRAPHPSRVRCDTGIDGWCDVDVEDLMSVSGHPGGAIGVHVLIAGQNGHTCSFAGDLRSEAAPENTAAPWVFHGGDVDWPCTLALEETRQGLELHGDGCRSYCGANAYLDAVFTLHE